MSLLFYDTETTGMPVWHKPSGGDNQPHIVQLGGILTDSKGEDLATLDKIIKPDGWEIPQDMVDIHGITTERAMDEGIPEEEALTQFLELVGKASSRIAHNEPFDARIIRIALKRYGRGDYADEVWKPFDRHCTVRMSKRVMEKDAPSHKLPDVHAHFLGQPHENQHTAMGDALACKAIYFAIKAKQDEAA